MQDVIAQYMLSLCVYLSVCPLQVGVMLKWINIGSHKQRLTIAQCTLVSDAKVLNENSNRVTPSKGTKCKNLLYQLPQNMSAIIATLLLIILCFQFVRLS